MKVKKLVARKIKDTRGDETIEIKLISDFGEFIASAPNGKSKGEFEVKPWKKSLKGDINAVNKYFIEDINLTEFDDLILIWFYCYCYGRQECYLDLIQEFQNFSLIYLIDDYD